MTSRARILAAVFAGASSLACAPVPGEGHFVHVDSEEAIIVWDAGAQREHFIRRASFQTDAKDFGFLVPTPSKPELGEADDAAFLALAQITASPTTDVPPPQPAAKSAPAAALAVLERKVVAGLDAAVLEATDADALYRWLKENGYRSDPDLVDWTRPYVERGWKITAFKIAGGSPAVTTKAVRMSFQTERPFFPYREPASERTAGAEKRERLLRVYFLADARFSGALGENQAWPGTAVWSNSIAEKERLQLLKLAKLPVLAGGGGRRLTEFEDASSPRPGTDEVYFARSADQSTLAKPARYTGAGGISLRSLAGGAILLLLAGGLGYSVSRFMKRSHG